MFYHLEGTISNPELILLGDGSTLDAFGNAITFAKIQLIYIKNQSTDTIVIGAGANPIDIFTLIGDTIELTEDGVFLWTCKGGHAITHDANDALNIAGTEGAIELLIIGTV